MNVNLDRKFNSQLAGHKFMGFQNEEELFTQYRNPLTDIPRFCIDYSNWFAVVAVAKIFIESTSSSTTTMADIRSEKIKMKYFSY